MTARLAHAQPEETYRAVGKEMSAKESLIEKYQIEIRQRTDEIEKKMYRVDRLNKKYEKMVDAAGGGEVEAMGPMEGAIKNLSKQIDTITAECRLLEREWLKKQTELVGVAAEGDKIAEANTELQARGTILTQQQLRLTQDLRELKDEVRAGKTLNIDFRKDVSTLNVMISDNHEKEGELQNDNYVLELGCLEELKEMERQSVQLTATVKETRSAKAGLLDEIIEAERQAMLWEKKIQLDKETKEALDPTVGEDETANMTKEIHRMELRFEALKREQERLSGEMERAILKRGAIQTRYSKNGPDPSKTKKKEDRGMKDLTQATAKKKMSALKKEARALAEQGLQYTTATEERRAQLSEISSELERTSTDYADCEGANSELQTRINDLLYRKQLNQERIGYKNKYLKRVKELAHNGVDASQSLQIERRLLGANQGLENVVEIIADLEKTHPHLVDVLDRVKSMTDPSLDVEPPLAPLDQ
jgi:chromosome segregation ATPase